MTRDEPFYPFFKICPCEPTRERYNLTRLDAALGRVERLAGVAQLAEHNVANVVVEGSNPFARSADRVQARSYKRRSTVFNSRIAGVAQLAEHNVANVVVEGSNPFARSADRVQARSYKRRSTVFNSRIAGVAQLAEHNVANVVVEGSNPFARSIGGRPRFWTWVSLEAACSEHLALPRYQI